jgi:hypothetical protein
VRLISFLSVCFILTACGGGGGGASTAGTSATLTSIVITPSSPSVFTAATKQLTATGFYSNGSSAVLSSGVTWYSYTNSVATVVALAAL